MYAICVPYLKAFKTCSNPGCTVPSMMMGNLSFCINLVTTNATTAITTQHNNNNLPIMFMVITIMNSWTCTGILKLIICASRDKNINVKAFRHRQPHGNQRYNRYIWIRDIFAAYRCENFMCKLRLNNTHNQLWIHENRSNKYIRNDVSYLV